jgi:isopenicillin N synthase-like dioxygenase
MATDFTTLPIVDYSALQREGTKEAELKKLKNAIFDVGFLYLINTSLETIVTEMHALTPNLFELSQEEKEKVNMRNSPSFLGYTCLGAETTAKRTDLREVS